MYVAHVPIVQYYVTFQRNIYLKLNLYAAFSLRAIIFLCYELRTSASAHGDNRRLYFRTVGASRAPLFLIHPPLRHFASSPHAAPTRRHGVSWWCVSDALLRVAQSLSAALCSEWCICCAFVPERSRAK